jgi:phenylacetate-coenzyme A ligase PaaK-like adenylate-forming protein
MAEPSGTIYLENVDEAREAGDFSEALRSSYRDFISAMTAGEPKKLSRENFADHPIYHGLSNDYLTKADLRRSKTPFDLKRSYTPSHWKLTTSGTSGPPLEVTYSSHFYFMNLYQVFARTAWIYGLRNGEELNLSTVFLTDNSSYEPTLYRDPAGIGGELRVFPIKSTEPLQMQGVLDELSHLVPDVLSTKPNLLGILLETAMRAKTSLKFKLIITSGAVLPAALRKGAEAFFACPVVSSYNTSELGYIGSECKFGNFHLDLSLHKVEVLCQDGAIAQIGQGELLVSSDANDCMPLWRYKTGDRVILANGKCDCGLHGSWISDLQGRSVPLFHVGGNETFSPTRWMKFFECFPEVEEYQVQQMHLCEFLIRIQLRDPAELVRLLPRLSAFFKSTLPKGDFQFVSAIFDEKHSRFIAREL